MVVTDANFVVLQFWERSGKDSNDQYDVDCQQIKSFVLMINQTFNFFTDRSSSPQTITDHLSKTLSP